MASKINLDDNENQGGPVYVWPYREGLRAVGSHPSPPPKKYTTCTIKNLVANQHFLVRRTGKIDLRCTFWDSTKPRGTSHVCVRMDLVWFATSIQGDCDFTLGKWKLLLWMLATLYTLATKIHVEKIWLLSFQNCIRRTMIKCLKWKVYVFFFAQFAELHFGEIFHRNNKLLVHIYWKYIQCILNLIIYYSNIIVFHN